MSTLVLLLAQPFPTLDKLNFSIISPGKYNPFFFFLFKMTLSQVARSVFKWKSQAVLPKAGDNS